MDGLMVGGLAGFLSGQLLSIPSKIFGYVTKRLMFTITVDQNDPSFVWLQSLMSEECHKSRYFSIRSLYGEDQSFSILFWPQGVSRFKLDGRTFYCVSTKEKMEHDTSHRETINIKSWKGKKEHFEKLINEAKYRYTDKTSKVNIWAGNGSYWKQVDAKEPRKRETLVLPLYNSLYEDAKKFLEEKQWYNDLGIPYRRGYLLHGPPGNGKSSLVHVLASELSLPIYVLSLSHLSDLGLNELMRELPNKCIVLIEDADAVWRDRETKGLLTMSGLLNAIDSPMAKEGRILIMTSNYPERLDNALVRPGRIDRQYLIENASYDQAKLMYERFFNEDGSEFATKAQGWSMAKVQEACLNRRANGNGDNQESEIRAERHEYSESLV